MKKKLILFLFAIITITGLLNQEAIVTYVLKNYIYKNEIVIPKSNQYHMNRQFGYVQTTDNFVPQNKQDLLNIIYTTLERGWKDFTFLCPEEYKTCTTDLNNIFEDQSALSHLNNFVHPFNSYNSITVDYTSLGRVDLHVNKLYSDNQIMEINKKIDEIINELIKPEMNERDKIKVIHDYIINNTVYDEEKATLILQGNKVNDSNSTNAYGLLFEHKAICGGYADTMALFLDKLNIPNFKVSTYDHVWNVVELDNNLYHLDLTWDDPVTSTHENILTYTFFLLTNEELSNHNTGQHSFDQKIYLELAK